jgi:hypothetical protein
VNADVLPGRERRRRIDEKLRIVAETQQAEARVSALATNPTGLASAS